MKRVVLVALLLAACAPAQTDTGPDGSPDGAAPVTWRVASYNIRHGEGMDGRLDLERTAAALARLDADVIALQEVDERVERSGGVDQAARLGELLGMNHAFGAFMDYQGGRYGLAILTRCEVRRAEPLRLTDGNEPRVALVVDVADVNGDVLTVVGVHFDWVADDGFRFAQASEVARHLDGLESRWILAGDLNDRPGSRTLALFQERATEAAKPRDARFTFPSNEPEREIDFIFAGPSGAWRVDSARVVADTLTSDHRPVVAELRGPREAAAGGERRACPVADESARGAVPDSSRMSSAGLPVSDSAFVALEGEGLRIFLASTGSARPLPFGTSSADVLALLSRVFGAAPAERGENADCAAEYARWDDGLTTWFANGRFAGWSVAPDSRLTTVDGLGPGATRSELEASYDAMVAHTSLGVEFTAAGVAGVLESEAADARVRQLWSGQVCIAR